LFDSVRVVADEDSLEISGELGPAAQRFFDGAQAAQTGGHPRQGRRRATSSASAVNIQSSALRARHLAATLD
jgi:hypothetical protein